VRELFAFMTLAVCTLACGSVPDLVFRDLDATIDGERDGGDAGDGAPPMVFDCPQTKPDGAACCGQTGCWDMRGACICNACSQLQCKDGKICCFDLLGNGVCKFASECR
jgi:hypothetical protein